ncbi:HEAT repeat domain-containing protein [Haliangium sp.]|uniref:HEAT repeat domain-containing protein n=1 Tax=Haliangium sp. TaxID=2663208 RepID=UPI003D0E4161
MPSRLSSLLVADGVVSVKRMEHAFQRQVIYGGCLDTILLEMTLLPEDRLVQYLAKATGLPPATRDETEAVDPAAVDICGSDVARMYRVVPVCFADGALRILVHDPVDMAQLEEMANDLGTPVQPLVVPEYRFHLVFARVFGGTADARYLTLARSTEDSRSVTPPVGKPRTVIVDVGATSAHDAAPAARDDRVATDDRASTSSDERASTSSDEHASTQADEAAPVASESVDEVSGSRRREKRTIEMATAALARRAEVEPPPVATGHAPTQPVESAEVRERSRRAKTSPGTGTWTDDDLDDRDTTPLLKVGEGRDRAASAGVAPAQFDSGGADDESAQPISALTPGEARTGLAQAKDRDQVFNLLLRAVRSRVRYAGLFTVQGRVAVGRVAIDGDHGDREQIAQASLSLDLPSLFRNLVSSAAPQLGPLRSGHPEVDAALVHLGNPAQGVLLPVVLRNRVVAIVVAHDLDRPVGGDLIPALLPLVGEAAAALSRIIVKAKQTRTQGTASTDATAPTGERATISSPPPGRAAIETLLDAVARGGPGADTARDAALARADEALAALATRFPGPLRVERYELEGRVLPAAEHSPLLGLVVSLGAAAGPLLIAKLDDPDRDTRFFATLCASESHPPDAAAALVERLFDSDYGVRTAAIDALAGYPDAVLAPALASLRDALRSDTAGRAQAAANALGKLGDPASVPVLIDVLAEAGDGAEAARRALVKLTAQDFGTSARKWRSWWQKHSSQHRVEWLVEALGHKDENLRAAAADELRTRTGEHFGFYHDLPKKERELARERWSDWWEHTGRARFAPSTD